MQSMTMVIQDVLIEINELSSDHIGGSLTLAIDGYGWIYQIIRGSNCREEIISLEYDATIKYVNHFMAKVNKLRAHNIKPYIVFDGAKLQIKNVTHELRAREEEKREGNKAKYQAAAENPAQKLSVTHDIVYVLIQKLKLENVTYVVAPYEADPQLAYICLEGKADAILTSDSDLIAYGCKKIIFRDTHKQKYKLFEWSRLEQSKAFGSFTRDMILQTCIMGGCDYLSIQGVGILGACTIMSGHKKVMREESDYLKVLKAAGMLETNTEKIRNYMDMIKNIMKTFKHQRVYNPDTKTVVHLTEMPSETEDDYMYVGLPVEQEYAEGIATGDLDPVTKENMEEKMKGKMQELIKGLKTGYVYSNAMVTDNKEFTMHVKMQELYRSTRSLMDNQRHILEVAKSQRSIGLKQIERETELSELWRACGENNASNVMGEAASSCSETCDKVIEEQQDYTEKLLKIIKPLQDMQEDSRLPTACSKAEHYSQLRRQAEVNMNVKNVNDDQKELDELKKQMEKLATGICDDLADALSKQEPRTLEISTEMVQLKRLHLEKLAAAERRFSTKLRGGSRNPK